MFGVRVELTTVRYLTWTARAGLWDWRATFCANEALNIIGEVHFRLLGTNGFHVKVKNERFTAASSRCRQNLKQENFTSSFCWLRQNIEAKSVPHVQHDYFSSLIQPIKSLICGVVAMTSCEKTAYKRNPYTCCKKFDWIALNHSCHICCVELLFKGIPHVDEPFKTFTDDFCNSFLIVIALRIGRPLKRHPLSKCSCYF